MFDQKESIFHYTNKSISSETPNHSIRRRFSLWISDDTAQIELGDQLTKTKCFTCFHTLSVQLVTTTDMEGLTVVDLFWPCLACRICTPFYISPSRTVWSIREN